MFLIEEIGLDIKNLMHAFYHNPVFDVKHINRIESIIEVSGTPFSFCIISDGIYGYHYLYFDHNSEINNDFDVTDICRQIEENVSKKYSNYFAEFVVTVLPNFTGSCKFRA